MTELNAKPRLDCNKYEIIAHSGQHPSPEKTYPKNRMFINSPLPLPSWSTSLKFLKIEKKGGGVLLCSESLVKKIATENDRYFDRYFTHRSIYSSMPPYI